MSNQHPLRGEAKHPFTEELMDYLEGGLLSEAEESAIRDHLVYCRNCADTLIRLHDEDVSIPAHLESTRPLSPDQTPPKRSMMRAIYPAMTLAAGLLLGVLIAFGLISPNRSSPAVNADYATFMPTDDSGLRGAAVLALPSENELRLLVFGGDLEPDLAPFSLEIHGPGDALVLQKTGITPNKRGQVVVSIMTDQLQTGMYKATLTNSENGEIVAVYDFKAISQ